MVVLVITGARAALEMPRVARMRVIGERRHAPERHRKRQHKCRNQQRNALSHLFSPPFSFLQRHETGLHLSRKEVAGCATGSARLS